MRHMNQRIRITIRGAVQGVGFRPFIYRLATGMDLRGWILNSTRGVLIEAEGTKAQLDAFLLRIERERPPHSFIQSLEFSFLDSLGFTRFEIRHSDAGKEIAVPALPDIATCSDCRKEIFDRSNRRFLYPFTNCTHCGPRFTIIESLPYDRENTTMRDFKMCGPCHEEYEDPRNRRFHAQPNACPACGPHLELWDRRGKILSTGHEALLEAADAVRRGKIVAIKGLGGFHLVADARSEGAVIWLRERKHRTEKPFALMYPSIESVEKDCEVSNLENRLLQSSESSIVLLRRRSAGAAFTIAPSVAPQNPFLGIMLPYTPLHHILMKELGFPIVATSGNLSDEPICTDEGEAIVRLQDIADLFLVHNRRILRHMDDSVVRVIMGREMVLRRARGYAPLPLQIKGAVSSVLAVGGHLKNSVAITAGDNVFISQHIGDLETEEAFEAFRKVITSFHNLYHVEPDLLVCDLHPDYISTRYAAARAGKTSLIAVQHHYAHVASCMAENELDGALLGVSWDGSGYGTDGTLWGGEFLLTDERSFTPVATFRRFRLPGGTQAVREPRRTAAGLLYEIFGEHLFKQEDILSLRSFNNQERIVIKRMLTRGINSPSTSSAGRLFDAVASLTGLCQRITFEGQAAMELEFAIKGEKTDDVYPFKVSGAGRQSVLLVDWEPMVWGILSDLKEGRPLSTISARFHNTLAEIIVDVAWRIGEQRIVLTGGCFQNRYLTERAVYRLEAERFRPYWHQRVPPNDGGISLGQIYAAIREMRGKQALAGVQLKESKACA